MADGTMPVVDAGASAPAPAPSAPVATEAAPQTPSPSEAVRAYMGGDFSALDPFAAPPPGGETPADVAVQPAPGTGQQPVAAPGTGPQPAPAADPREALLARMAELQAQQAAIQQQMVQAQAGGAQGAPAAPPPDPLASFSVPLGAIPDQLLAGMTSEDPNARRAAVSSLAQGLANQSAVTAIRYVEQKLGPVLNQVLPAAIRNIAAQVYQEQVNSAAGANAFYATNPDLNHPDLHPVVEMVAQRLVPQMTRGWTPEAQRMVAEETRRVLRTFAGSPTMPPAAALSPAPGMVGGAGVSPPRPNPSGPLTDEALMRETLRRHGIA